MYEGLKDKVVILTGDGGLMGQQSLKHLVRNGAKVVAVEVQGFVCEAGLFLHNDITQL